MSDHTPGIVTQCGVALENSEHITVARTTAAWVRIPKREIARGEAEANARRIGALWNLAEATQLTTEQLEAGEIEIGPAGTRARLEALESAAEKARVEFVHLIPQLHAWGRTTGSLDPALAALTDALRPVPANDNPARDDCAGGAPL